jgi:hypothetical protein
MTDLSHTPNGYTTSPSIQSVESAIDWLLANANPELDKAQVLSTLCFALFDSSNALAYLDKVERSGSAL